MSGDINNREYRKEKLRDIIAQLHEGRTVDEVKGEFAEAFGSVSAEEISQAEQALIAGGLPVSEVQRLCDVHAEVFRESIREDRPALTADSPGHPAHTLKAENAAMRGLIEKIRQGLRMGLDVREDARRLSGVDSHYKVKENLLFPYMEKYGVTAPPKVMWGVDDEIRADVAGALEALERGDAEPLKAAMSRLDDMAFKEENILLPILMGKLSEDEWLQVASDRDEFGDFLIGPPPRFTGSAEGADDAQAASLPDGKIQLSTGALLPSELEALLNTLPIDMTFVDKDGRVRYFSHGKDRAFPRPKSVLGREVANCHPPASLHVVLRVVDDLKSGRKDVEDFWIKQGEKLIHIRYFAVRGPGGEFLGVVETTQDIAPLQDIMGEKRILDAK
ncbi:MAG TPA: DUF438 domain-containing protein [Candidatus Limnocylindria bacterium]|nr:DUF438 domain-containing protein [Candidatus Limnocylindria bacterium]